MLVYISTHIIAPGVNAPLEGFAELTQTDGFISAVSILMSAVKFRRFHVGGYMFRSLHVDGFLSTATIRWLLLDGLILPLHFEGSILTVSFCGYISTV